MKARFRIQRYDPEQDATPHLEDYEVDLHETDTVLDGIIKIKDELDGSLAFRRSCRSAICGSCAMRLNHRPALACKTQVSPLVTSAERILVEPLANMALIKDLIVDMEPFWGANEAISPWLAAPEAEVSLERESLMSPAQAMGIRETAQCIMCGLCYSYCPVVTTNPKFLGPATFVKAYRFIADPRERGKRERLRAVSGEDGLWRCHTIFNCSEVCPKHIQITWAIQQLKRMAYLDRLGLWRPQEAKGERR